MCIVSTFLRRDRDSSDDKHSLKSPSFLLTVSLWKPVLLVLLNEDLYIKNAVISRK